MFVIIKLLLVKVNNDWKMLDVNNQILWYSDIVLATTSGIAIIANVAAAVIVYRWKCQNKSVQKFVFSLTIEAIVAAFLIGVIYSVIQIMRWDWVSELCGGFTWSFTAIATLQAATTVSAIIDRVYAVRWDFRYKYYVNQAQVRYHIVATAVVCGFVGAVPAFLRDRDNLERCQFLPYDFSFGFAAFIIIIYAFLSLLVVLGSAYLFYAARKLRACTKRKDVVMTTGTRFDGRSVIEHRDTSIINGRTFTSKHPFSLEETPLEGSWGRRTGTGNNEKTESDHRLLVLNQLNLVVLLAIIDFVIFHIPFAVSI